MNRGRRGFTLIELMIVVGIIGVLAAIALPQYLTNINRAKTVEALTILNIIKQQEYSHYAMYDCFAPTDQTPAGPPSHVPQRWVSALSGSTGSCGTRLSMADLDVYPHTGFVRFVYQCEVRTIGPDTIDFTCGATGDLDGDGTTSEVIYCTDHNSTGTCIPSSQGTPSLFPFEIARVSQSEF